MCSPSKEGKGMREDLEFREFMEVNGFTANIDRRDLNRITPNHALTFTRDDLNVWQIREGWQTARLVDGRYMAHKTFDNLREVVKYYKGQEKQKSK
jgi:hypothetical protein